MTVVDPTVSTLPRALEPKERDAVARWLLGFADAPSAEVLRAAGLGAYAYTVLPGEHARRRSVQPDFLASLRRHYEIKREMAPLFTAWREAGLDVMVFKGFQLAEFVYPVPGARFHNDVDVLIHPGDLERAAEITRSLGWHQGPTPVRPSFSHGPCNFVRNGGATMIDVHRWVIHACLPWHPVQRRITEAVWRNSRMREWERTDVREPSPVDSLLVGLVLQRCWGDDWRLKPFDIVDFQHLCTHCGIDREALWSRARTLRCERTLSLFLERCDPDAKRFDLSTPTREQQIRWNRTAFRERGLLPRSERKLARLLASPARTLAGAAYVPTVLRMRTALRRNGDVRKLLQAFTPPEDRVRQPPPDDLKRVVSRVRWAMRLVGPGRYGVCLVRSLAIYSLLRRRGWRVEFVSGVRRDGASIAGHAWLEHGGAVLWDLLEPNNHAIYRENFRFPTEIYQGSSNSNNKEGGGSARIHGDGSRSQTRSTEFADPSAVPGRL